jgi:hypothetical protein
MNAAVFHETFTDHDGYTVEVLNDRVTVGKAGQTKVTGLGDGPDELPTSVATVIRKAGGNPDDFFALGTTAVRNSALPLIGRAFLARWAAREEQRATAKADLASRPGSLEENIGSQTLPIATPEQIKETHRQIREDERRFGRFAP